VKTVQYSTVKLKDICDRIDYGYTASASDEPVGPRFLRITDIVPERLDWSNVPFCKIEPEKLEKYLLEAGDIVIARTGATTGWAKFIKEPPKAVFASYLVRVRTKASVDDRYVGFVVESQIYKDFVHCHIGGAAQPNANAQILTSYELPLPPLPAQRRIASILSAYDDLIENNQRRIKILEEMARSLYREWFVNFRFLGNEKVPLVDSPLGRIPKGWEVKRIADLCESVSYGFTASASREEIGPKFLRITDIVPELIDWDSVPYCETPDNNVRKYILLPGDIVVARTGATTGYAKRINKRHPRTVFASYLVRLRTKPGVSNRMLGLLMESVDYKEFIKANIGGAAQPQANAVVLSSMPLVAPPPAIAQKFDELVEPFLDKIEVLAEKSRKLRLTRDLLLPRLLSTATTLLKKAES
jgi:type I restriction enzyme, S subunit